MPDHPVGRLMYDVTLDATDWLPVEDGLPRPRWDLVRDWADARGPDGAGDAWVAAQRRWLAELGGALGPDYQTTETAHALLLNGRPGQAADLVSFAEQWRDRLLTVLPGVTAFPGPWKLAVVTLRDMDDYYRYIAPFFPDGEHGGSGGVHVREGLPHIALHGHGGPAWGTATALAHEMTHAALHHLGMPVWLEEGLAQMFEHDATGRPPGVATADAATKLKRYWSRHGLAAFWDGTGFGRPGRVQGYTYQLAEVLVRGLYADARPGWFGRGRDRHARFLAFLASARADDSGEAACREHLGVGLDEIAGRFLGPGRQPAEP